MWFLNLIPGLGGLLTGITDYLNKKQDVALEKYKVDGTVNVELIHQDTAIVEARARLAEAMKNDRGTKLARGAMMAMVVLYFGLIFWDSCFRNVLPPNWTWRVLALPENLQYLPYAIVAYLFVTAWKK